MKHMEIEIKPISKVLMMAKEVREIRDVNEAARLVQEDNWIITLAAPQSNGDYIWVLMRIG